ncbi:MAG TPA: hypothetical protein VKA08_04715 [Balneolales bacterium]|nr:hypothetical protein [Balneolales bacterium]
MAPSLRQKVAVLLLLVYVPVTFTLGLQHHDGPLYPPPTGLPVTLSQTNAHNVVAASLDGFCMACHFASGHIFEQPFHICSAIHDISILSPYDSYNVQLRFVDNCRKRGPPSFSIS